MEKTIYYNGYDYTIPENELKNKLAEYLRNEFHFDINGSLNAIDLMIKYDCIDNYIEAHEDDLREEFYDIAMELKDKEEKEDREFRLEHIGRE